MSRRRWKRLRPLAGDPSDPHGLVAWTQRYLEAIQTQHYSVQTLRTKRKALAGFLEWCEARGLRRPTAITRPILQRFQRHLFLYRKKNGKPLTVGTQKSRMVVLRAYFRWLTRENVILSNPASDLDLPRPRKRLPRHILTPREAEVILSQPDTSEVLGLRDRALLELVYSTGLRRMELASLEVFDLEAERGVVYVRGGKGDKDRVVPIGERALAWCETYLREARPQLRVPPDPGHLFLTKDGTGFSLTGLSQTIRKHVSQAGLAKKGSCHLFRHTMATMMLENGADVRYIQAILGHAQLSTTQVYTRVSVAKLKEVHSATHPAAKLHREPDEGEGDPHEQC